MSNVPIAEFELDGFKLFRMRLASLGKLDDPVIGATQSLVVVVSEGNSGRWKAISPIGRQLKRLGPLLYPAAYPDK